MDDYTNAIFGRKQKDQFTQVLIDARVREKLTQTELASRLGIKPSSYCAIERGKSSPKIATLHKIAKAMGKELFIEFLDKD